MHPHRARGRRVQRGLWFGAAIVVAACSPRSAMAQESRTAIITEATAEKARRLEPYKENRVEEFLFQLEQNMASGTIKGWHPFLDSAYAGGGVVVGVGNTFFVSPYNTVEIRGSWTSKNYKRIEAEFRAPRLFGSRGGLSVIGGWREALEVGFYGFGTTGTSSGDRTSYGFRQPYASAAVQVWPTRRFLVIGGGLEVTEWQQRSGKGSSPSVDEVYTADTLPGLGTSPTYLHASGSVALDWRPAPGYARRGGYYGITAHSYSDPDDAYSFRQVDYEAVQHIPILRDAWVLSLRGRVQTTHAGDGQVIPFFMQPAVGGGSTLRGFRSWRFRDRHTLLLSAEWRVLANRFLDMAVFYDAGKAVARTSDLDLDGLKSDVGLGFRLHGPVNTPLRIEVARSNERVKIVFAAKHAF